MLERAKKMNVGVAIELGYLKHYMITWKFLYIRQIGYDLKIHTLQLSAMSYWITTEL